MSTAPSISRRRCAHTSSRASARADDQRIFFSGSAIGLYLRSRLSKCFFAFMTLTVKTIRQARRAILQGPFLHHEQPPAQPPCDCFSARRRAELGQNRRDV